MSVGMQAPLRFMHNTPFVFAEADVRGDALRLCQYHQSLYEYLRFKQLFDVLLRERWVGGAARVCFRNPLLGHFPRHISLLFDASECSIAEKMARGNVGECEYG
ncbi:hypothetical protein CQR46_0098 [Bifidobacterium pseudolongum subsp. globosum]|uniref:Uncharacterized protein n=1 Tax=Bifidobacterium pseudolongum subsp. globosum TaxID=1690 RepID=A0A2N3QLJ5_9BIFI|nr:hypothetical protein CQR46_0098 [Bifidobacterium pseudolongum subsp. globosum]